MSVRVRHDKMSILNLKFLSPIYRKFSVECDRKSKISHSIRNLFFFCWRKVEFLEEKHDFLKSAKVAKLVLNYYKMICPFST